MRPEPSSEPSSGASCADREDLGEDRNCRLGGRLRSEIETGRARESLDFRLGQALREQPLPAALLRAP